MQRDLFSHTEHFDLPGGGELSFFRNWLASDDAHTLLSHLLNHIDWQQPYITIAGKRHKIPRLQTWYGEAGTGFTYSGTYFEPTAFTQALHDLMRDVEAACDTVFNSVLVNQYRNQHDSVGWHADDEPEFGPSPIIASLSVGAARRFQFKPKAHHYQAAGWSKGQRVLTFDLQHGDLLLMGKGVQEHWLHCVPKEVQHCSTRVNLTFRKVIKPI